MTLKEQFSDKDWQFLAQYPYRVGLWMSDQDIGGGESAVKAEMTALDNIVQRAQKKYENRGFIREIVENTRNSLRDMSGKNSLENVPKDGARVLSLLRGSVDEVDVNCFKLVCIDVAEAVARAASNGEMGTHNLYGGPEKGWFGLYPLFSSIMRWGRGPKVTQAEKDAINHLIDCLKANDIAVKWSAYKAVKRQD